MEDNKVCISKFKTCTANLLFPGLDYARICYLKLILVKKFLTFNV